MDVLSIGRPDVYWAGVEDPDEVGAYIARRHARYFEKLVSTGLFNRIRRSWRYYHNLFYDTGGGYEREIRMLGDRGELAGLAVNHLRNLLQHLLTITVQNPPSYDVLATNVDIRSIRQARFSNQLLEHYRYVKNLTEFYKQAVENALVCSAGYVMTTWDARKTAQVMTPGGVQQIPLGDLEWEAPGFEDVAFDWRQKDWHKKLWVSVRRMENKWQLAEEWPEFRDEILSYHPEINSAHELLSLGGELETEDDDYIPVLNFYHLGCDILPEGRFLKVIGEKAITPIMPCPYEDLPVDRVVPGNFLGTPFGYTPAFDLQGLQEAINGEISVILTNHKSFGVQSVWTRSNSNMTVEELRENLIHFQSDEKPEALNLTDTPPELFQFCNILRQEMEYISGVNSVLRGQPEANLKSGRAIALIAAQSVQFASTLILGHSRLLEENGTKTIRLLRTYAEEPRLIALTGKHNRSYLKEFSGGDLSMVDRVKVTPGNAMMRTLAGRIEMADKLLDRNMIRNREEYITVIETGQLEAMLEAEDAQIGVVREENERLLDGGQHKAIAIDFHVLHIREHHAQLNTTEARLDPMLSTVTLAAVMEHMQMLLNPMVQLFQTALGFPTVVPPMAGVPMPGAGAAPPGEPGRPPSPQTPLDQSLATAPTDAMGAAEASNLGTGGMP